ncbi:MAG: choice-of-anchor D domain-containing protein [Candidatus Kapaibacterium sp.]
MKRLRTLFIAALVCVAGMSVNAQHQRKVLFEEFTAMTCPPCATLKPAVEAFAKTDNVITVTYHQSYPAPGDPYNVLDNNVNRVRHDWYGVTGIPSCFMNGKKVNNSLGAFQAAAAPYLSQQSPVLITVTEDRSATPIKVKITVKNDGTQDLSGVSLHTQVINYYADLTNYPDVVNNQYKRYTTFEYCIMKAMPTITGQSITVPAGTEKTYEYSYSIGSNTNLWTSPYVIAFIQNMSTKEVLQAGTSFESISKKVSVSSTENQFMMTARNKAVKKTVTLKNEGNSSMTVSVDFAATPAVPAGWSTPTLSSNNVTVPGKGTATVDIMFNTTATGGSVFGTIIAKPTGGGLNLESSYDFGYVADNTKYCVLAGYSQKGLVDAYTVLNGLAKYKNEVAYVPAMQSVFDQLGQVPFTAVVCPVDFANRGNFVNDQFAGIVADMFNSGKRLVFYGDAALYNSMMVSTLPQGWNSFFRSIGMSGLNADPTARINTSTGVPIAFSIRGVSKDEIGDGVLLNLNSNTSTFNYYSEDIAIDNSINGIKPFLYYDNNTATNAAVRLQSDVSRAVILGFPIEAIANASARSVLYGKIMDWVTAEITVVKTPDIKITGNSGETVDFGSVQVGKDKTLTAELKNSGSGDLTISAVDVDAAYKGSFEVTLPNALPMVIAPGDKRVISIKFKPAKEEDIFTTCTIKSNAKSASVDGENYLGINAVATASTSVDQGTSGDGMLSVAAAPNPANGVSRITYTVAGTTPQNVTVSVVDALGNTVANLAQGVVAPGSHVTPFNTAGVAAGAYKVVVRTGTSSSFIPVVVVK